MFVRLPVQDTRTGEIGLMVIEIEDFDGPLSAVECAGVIPALIAEGVTVPGLVRLTRYRSAIRHGYVTDEMRPGESEHVGPLEMPGDIDPLYGLTEAQAGAMKWLHADRVTGRIGGPNDGEVKA